jgi:hypothetical protein
MTHIGWALYSKEWKEGRHVFAFLMVAIALLGAYGWTYFEPDILKVGPRALLSYIPFLLGGAACFIAPPFLLARSFSTEWKSDTHYLMFSLPIWKCVPSLAKYLVALSNGLIMFGLMGSFVFAVMITHWGGEDTVRPAYDDLVWIAGLGFLAYLILMLGFVTAMEGVKSSVKRFQRLASIGFAVMVLFFYLWFYGQIVVPLSILGGIQLETVKAGQVVMVVWEFSLASFAYPALVGILLLILGLALFEKNVEI